MKLFSSSAMAAVLAILALAPPSAFAQACQQTLSPGANVGSAIAGAAAGSTLCLSNGSYGGFRLTGVAKSPRVTVRAVTRLGASFTGSVDIGGDTHGLTFDGVNFTDVSITGANTRELTFRNHNQTGKLLIDGVTTATPNILLEDFTHNNVTAATAPGARIHFAYSGRSSPVATIRRATIDGGCADGIQSGVPFILEDSRLMNMQVGSCPNDPHTDAVQLYGGPFAGTVIRGNHFYRNVQVLAAYDGVDNLLVENNVFDPGPDGERRPCQIELYSDDGSIVRHNTVVHRGDAYGHICLDRKPADDAGFGTVVVDNIANSISIDNGSAVGLRSRNLLRTGASGSDIVGVPVFVGGTNPATREGFELAAGSPGKAAASSPAGSDIGVSFEYSLCAAERAECRFTGAAEVVYGARSSWTLPRTFFGPVACNNTTFGDPLPFVVKTCRVKAVAPLATDTPPAGYTRCTPERKDCQFAGTADVVYGARSTWTPPRAFFGGVACTNATFGDPLPGVVKSCYVKAVEPLPTDRPPAGYVLCTAESKGCTLTKVADLVYGAGSTWTAARPLIGGVPCNNRTFGDPLPGVVKACYVRAAAPETVPVNLANRAPTVANAIADQGATQGTRFVFQFAGNTFAGADVGDRLTYTATRSDGSALPAWLTFQAGTRTFSGTPTLADRGTLGVRVRATDSGNASVSDDFTVTVGPPASDVGWMLTTANTGLAGVGLTCDGLPPYTGPAKPAANTTISLVRITLEELDLSNGHITLDRVCVRPTTAGVRMGMVFGYNPDTGDDQLGPVTIQDSDFDGSLITNSSNYASCAFRGAGNLYRNKMFGMGNGICYFGTPSMTTSVIEGNYVYGLRSGFYGTPPQQSHNEAATIRSFTGTSLQWRNNRLESLSGADSGAMFIQTFASDIRNVTLSGNLFHTMAWNLPLEAAYGNTYSNMQAINNRFVVPPGGFGVAYVTGGPGWAVWSENYRYDASAPDGKGTVAGPP